MPTIQFLRMKWWLCIVVALFGGVFTASAKKSLMIAIDVEGLVDFSNLVEAGSQQGAVYDTIHTINDTIVRPLNEGNHRRRRQHGHLAIPHASRRTVFNNLDFTVEEPVHLTLTYVGYLNGNDQECEPILKEVQDKLKRALAAWLQAREDKMPLECVVGKVIWPPIGHKGIWLSYGVRVSHESEGDFLKLLNSIQGVLSGIDQEWNGPFRDARNNMQRDFFRRYRSLENVKLHISLGRFHKGYNLNPTTNAVFDLPKRYKVRIDELFEALPAIAQPTLRIRECALYVKDEEHHIERLQSFPLSEEILTQ